MTLHIRRSALLSLIGALALSSGIAADQGGRGFGPPGGQGGFGGPGGPGMQEEIKLVKQFDKDGDKILNSAERKAAKAYLESSNSGGGGRMGRMGGPRGGGNTGTIAKGRTISPKDVPTYTNAGFFDANTFRTFFLTFEDADWESQLVAFKNTDVDVPATVVLDGKTYKDVGVKFHGSSSFFMVGDGQKRSLNLKLDLVHADQQIGGQHTLILLNSAEDATFLRSVLFLTVARAYLPASQANHVRVAINGESWGTYVNVQHYSKDFIKEHFNTTDGARWKVPGNPGARGGLEYLGDDPAAYNSHYEIKSKDDPKSWAAFINLCKVLNTTPADKLEAALAPILDVDGMLRFLAVDNALVNDDGYWTRSSDFSIYLDTKGMFHVFPWDSNETFAADSIGSGENGRGRGPGGGRMGPPPDGFGPPNGFGPPGGFDQQGRGGRGGRGPGGPGGMGGGMGSATLDPLSGLNDTAKPLRSKLFAVPALRAKYLGYVKDIATKWLDWNTLGPVADAARARITDEVKADPKKLDSNEAYESAYTALQKFAADRRAYLLSYTDPSVKK